MEVLLLLISLGIEFVFIDGSLACPLACPRGEPETAPFIGIFGAYMGETPRTCWRWNQCGLEGTDGVIGTIATWGAFEIERKCSRCALRMLDLTP